MIQANMVEKRLARVRRSLGAAGLDGLLVTCQENRFYLSGFSAHDTAINESSGALLITRHRDFLLTDGRYQLQAREEAAGFQLIVYKKGLAEGCKQALEITGDSKINRIAYEPSFITCETLQRLRSALGDLEFKPYGQKLVTMRSIKDEQELDAIRSAVSVAEDILQDIWDRIKQGMTEKEVAFMLLEGCYLRADGPSFPPIVASGPNAALPHAVPSDRRIREGEPVIIDMGVRLNGYCSDMTRTLFVGEPDDQFRNIYMVVKRAQAAAQNGIAPGISARTADMIARKVIQDAGYGDFFVHSLGHGVGIAVHEMPTLSFRNRTHLRPGMVITVEPGIYLPGRGGVRLENMAVVREDGLEVLNSSRWYYEFRA